jgi:hypothetical protein
MDIDLARLKPAAVEVIIAATQLLKLRDVLERGQSDPVR